MRSLQEVSGKACAFPIGGERSLQEVSTQPMRSLQELSGRMASATGRVRVCVTHGALRAALLMSLLPRCSVYSDMGTVSATLLGCTPVAKMAADVLEPEKSGFDLVSLKSSKLRHLSWGRLTQHLAHCTDPAHVKLQICPWGWGGGNGQYRDPHLL